MNTNIDHLIAEIPIFNELDTEERELLKKYLFPKDLSIGDIVCKEGQHGNFLCFVASGKLEVSKNIDGKNVIIAIIEEGGSLGEMALIDGLTRSATVKARALTSVLVLKRNDFQTLINDNPIIGVKILKGIARFLSLNLRKTSSQFTKYMLSLA